MVHVRGFYDGVSRATHAPSGVIVREDEKHVGSGHVLPPWSKFLPHHSAKRSIRGKISAADPFDSTIWGAPALTRATITFLQSSYKSFTVI
jgi:hypothetical protein